MSDPLGQGTTPEKPAFSGPEGYGTTTISIQSYGAQKPELVEEQAPHVLKGVSVGTFVPKNQPTIDSVSYVLPPNKPEPRPRRVGAEVRSPEMEELIRLGRFAKQGGITFDVDDQGNVESVNLPPELASDEEALRLELMQQKVEADILKKLFPLSLLFTENDKDADFLKPKLQNPATVAVIESLSQKLSGLIQEVHAKPDGAKLDEIREALADFKKAVERARTEVSRIPVPPPTPAPTTPPATPAPTAAPTQEPLREYGGWPYDVYFRKPTKNNPNSGGWVSRDNPNEILPDQELWENESKAFKIVYDRYTAFLRPLKLAERQLLKPLIDARARVIEAIKDKDVMRVAAMREEFETTLEDWQKRWVNLDKLKEAEKKFDNVKKSAEEVVANLGTENERKNIRTKQDEIIDQLRKAKDSILKGNDVDFDKIVGMVEGYKNVIDSYQKTQNALGLQTKMGRSVLRPIIATDKNKNQEIFTRENGKMTVGEYAAQLERKKEDDKVVELTAADIATWPELVKAGRSLNSRVHKEWFAKFQIAMKYRRMLEKDENAFLSLYVTPSENPDTHEILYTATENLRTHPEKEMIKMALEEKGIFVVEKTRTERREDERKEAERERLNITVHGTTYNPSKDMKSGFFEKRTEKISNGGGMVTNKDRAMEIKKKGGSMAESVEKAPEKPRWQETLKKVNDILGARENWFTKKKNSAPGTRWWDWWIVAGVITGAVIVDRQRAEKDDLAREWGVPTVIVEDGAANGPTAKVETLEDWRNYVLDQRFAKNLITLSDNEFIRREAAGIMDLEKHDNIEKILNIEGYKLINDGDAYPELGKEKGGERDKLCEFVLKLEKLSQAVEAPKKDLARRTSALYNGPNDTIMTPGVTIKEYIGMLKKKITDADALRKA